MHDMKHMDFLEDVAKCDVQTLRRKESTYQGSWKKRGGIGAFMMLARKWDRLDVILEHTFGYDLFSGIMADTNGADGSVLAEVRDLRQYLLLVEAEIQSRLAGQQPSIHRPIPEISDPSNLYDAIAAELNLPRARVKRTIIASGYQTNSPDDLDSKRIIEAANRYTSADSFRTILIRKHDAEHGVEDSNRQAAMVTEPDWDARAGAKQADGSWKVKPLISATMFNKLKDPDLKARFIVTGTYAQVDRRQYSEQERASLFLPLSATVACSDYNRLPDHDTEFYEARPGVSGEFQLKEMYREAWIG